MNTRDAADDPELDWYDYDDDDAERSNPLFKTLAYKLAQHQVQDEAAILSIHRKLLYSARECRAQHAVARAFGPKQRQELEKECRTLESAARRLGNVLEGVIGDPFVNQVLVLAYQQVLGADHAREGPSDAGETRRWPVFRENARKTVERMEETAAAARTALAVGSGRTGRPAQHWRNVFMSELHRDLAALIPHGTNERIAELSSEVWEDYFGYDDGHEDVVSPETLQRYVNRYRRRSEKSGT